MAKRKGKKKATKANTKKRKVTKKTTKVTKKKNELVVLVKEALENGKDWKQVRTLLDKEYKDKFPKEYKREDDKLHYAGVHYASLLGRVDVLKVLIRHGADVNAVTPSNETALLLAVKRGHLTIVKVLI